MTSTIQAREHTTASWGFLLAFLFAVCGLAIHTVETWIPSWEVKVGEKAPVTVRLPARYFRITLLRNEVHYLSTTSSTCPQLIPKGKVLKPGGECAGLAAAFESARRSISFLHIMGLFAFYLAIGLILVEFMRHPSMGRARLLRAEVTIFALLVGAMGATKLAFLFTPFPSVMVPILAVPILVGHFFKRQVAFAVVIATSLTTVSLVNFDIELFLIFTISGMAAVLTAGSEQHRYRTLLKSGAMAGWITLGCVIITTLIFSGTLNIYDDPDEHFDPRYSLWIAAVICGLASGVIAMALAPIFGRLVGEISRNSLLDLQDLNQRLLKRIQELAPGTWEHSRAMANLAEAAANAIGGNATLARVGAYYHDVGKSNLPDYFIENQGGKENPHDEMTPEESASYIFRHVTEGTRLLRQESVPEDVVEFCYSHHGTSLLEFFWHKVMASGNPEELSERDFTYPGHKPSTRETGILMLVDAIEAGARTVDTPEKEAFKALVQAIVFSKLSQGQLDETGLSLSDLRVIVNTLIDTLVNMYHARIKYPWQTGDTKSRISPPPPKPPEETKPEEKPEADSPSEEMPDEVDIKVDDKDAEADANALTLIQPAKPNEAPAAEVPVEKEDEPVALKNGKPTDTPAPTKEAPKRSGDADDPEVKIVELPQIPRPSSWRMK